MERPAVAQLTRGGQELRRCPEVGFADAEPITSCPSAISSAARRPYSSHRTDRLAGHDAKPHAGDCVVAGPYPDVTPNPRLRVLPRGGVPASWSREHINAIQHIPPRVAWASGDPRHHPVISSPAR